MYSHCASGVKYAWRDSNLLWEGERWFQVLSAEFCSQDSGTAIQAVSPASKRSLACCFLLVGDFRIFVHLLTACLSDPGCKHCHPGEILLFLCPQGPQRTCLDSCSNHITPTSVHLHSGGEQQSPHICARVQTPKELPKEEEARKENCGDHQHLSVVQQIKGLLAAKQEL